MVFLLIVMKRARLWFVSFNPFLPSSLQIHDTAMEHEQRILVETIVSILPPERNSASCGFLFNLLRTAIILDTTIACRLDLERRIGIQLEQATLDDLLIPSFSYTGDTLFDVDIIQRILVNFLQQDDSDDLQVQLLQTYSLTGL
jgi:hypothetical protein